MPPFRRLISTACDSHAPFERTATKSTAKRPIMPSRESRSPTFRASRPIAVAYAGSAGRRQPT